MVHLLCTTHYWWTLCKWGRKWKRSTSLVQMIHFPCGRLVSRRSLRGSRRRECLTSCLLSSSWGTPPTAWVSYWRTLSRARARKATWSTTSPGSSAASERSPWTSSYPSTEKTERHCCTMQRCRDDGCQFLFYILWLFETMYSVVNTLDPQIYGKRE